MRNSALSANDTFGFAHVRGQGSKRPQARKRVLIVDDDPAMIILTRAKLEDAGYEVYACTDAIEATLALHRVHPSILLLDVKMPGLSGDLLAMVLSRTNAARGVAVIFHSSLDQAELDELVKRTRALGAIRKTTDSGHFLHTLRTLLEQRS